MSDFKNTVFEDIFNAYSTSYKSKDDQKIDIAFRKTEYESALNDFWKNYKKNPKNIVEYNKQLQIVKNCGCKVLRNSQGKHKIIIGGNN